MSDRLQDALGGLVADGVLSSEQADAVRRAVASPAQADGVSPAVEIAAWVGAILAGAAGFTAATRFWAELQVWAQTALLLVVAVALYIAGELLFDDERPAARRITGVAWLGATFVTAAAVWVPIREAVERADAAPFFAAALVATGLGAWFWRRTRGALQLIALFGGVLTALLSGLALPDRAPWDLYGVVVMALGAATVLLAWANVAQPRRTGLLLGGLSTLVGAEILFFSYERTAVVLGLLSIAGLFRLGVLLSDVAFTGMSAFALAVFVPQALSAFFPGSLNASATLFVAGVLVLAGALVTFRTARTGGALASSPAASTDPGEPGEPGESRESGESSMADTTPKAETADRKGSRMRPPSPRVAVLVALGLIASTVIGILLFGRLNYPDFPMLRDNPQPEIAGQVAWLSWDEREGNCLWVVDASGGEPRTVLCADGLGSPVSWSDDGLIELNDHRTRSGLLVAVDPESGRVVRRTPLPDMDPRVLNPEGTTDDGSTLLIDGRRGEVTLSQMSAGGVEREVVTVSGPRDYHWWASQVSPDGDYALIQDSGQRLLVVRLADGEVWVLAEDAGDAAWGNAKAQ